jgi:hypothetical protein
MPDVCLFCDRPEKTYQPKVEFICGTCVAIILRASMDERRRAYEQALGSGHTRKAYALETFLPCMEDKDGKAENPERDLVRKRPVPAPRPTRDQVRA